MTTTHAWPGVAGAAAAGAAGGHAGLLPSSKAALLSFSRLRALCAEADAAAARRMLASARGATTPSSDAGDPPGDHELNGFLEGLADGFVIAAAAAAAASAALR